jgi:hypothetical protein
VRLVHYDRNLGKGYAVKVGALEARGRWVAYCDADLDLDPASIPVYVAEAEREGLDFAIGSKRHPESSVVYPRSRRVASWLFQKYVRVLFQLDVRDTQVGLKVFRREVAEQVMPLLLVKRYAFDIELLAVARSFGFSRVREMPVTLDYQFTGSGVSASAVIVALVDTVAIFYRLRLVKTYRRKRALFGAFGWTRPSGFAPRVAIVADGDAALRRLEGNVRLAAVAVTEGERRQAADDTDEELLAFIESGGTTSGNFLSATVPFFARPEVTAVVVSNVAPTTGSDRERAAAAIRESRLGGGSQYYRFMPGNIRYVRAFRSASFIVRRSAYVDLPAGLASDDVPAAIAEAGGSVLYTPEAFVVVAAAPLFRPHLEGTIAYGRARAFAIARQKMRALQPSTVFALVVAPFLALGWLLVLVGRDWLALWVVAIVGYGVAVLLQATFAAVQHRSRRIGGLVAMGLVLTHGAYVASLAAGLVRARGSRHAVPTRRPQARV